MNVERQLRFWLVGLALFAIGLFFLRDILLPFVAGMAVAYLLDPICDRLEAWGLSRPIATSVLTILFMLVGIGLFLLLVPVVVGQLVNLIKNAPAYLESLRDSIFTLVTIIESRVEPEVIEELRGALSGAAARLLEWSTDVLGGVISGGVALANLLSLLFITPIVTFYLLRDWDRIVETVDSWLPRQHAKTIRKLVLEVDERLAGFLRGQGMVCVILGVFYAVALSIAQLQFGLIVGLIAGLASFIPFVGAILGLVLSVGLALVQFDDWMRIAIVAGIFFLGQAIEGNLLTPRIVGDRVGLHPVWIMFGLLAGGALFGFVGVLLAVPAAAVAGVGTRFALDRYIGSTIYTGPGGDVPAADGDTDSPP